MADPVVREAVERMLREEVLPLLPEVDGIELPAYLDETLQRFATPAIGDGLARLARRGTVKMPSYLLPSLQDALAQGRPHRLLPLAVAGWIRFLCGVDLSGRRTTVEDPELDRLRALLDGCGHDPRRLLGMRSVFGTLGDSSAVVAELAELVRLLERHGLEAALATCRPAPEALVA